MFNALNSIYSYTLEKPQHASELLLRLAQLTRYQLDGTKNDFLPLTEELDFLENYILLEESRFGDRCRIAYEVEGDAADNRILPMLLIPFVENAFKHGVSTTYDPSFVSIRIIIGGHGLEMNVRNSLPHKLVRQVTSTWTGLSNTRKRLQLVYPKRHYLSVRKQKETYEATLFIKL